MAVTTRDCKTYEFTLTTEQYQVLMQVFGIAIATVEHLERPRFFREFMALSLELTDVRITRDPQTLAGIFKSEEGG